MAIERVQSKWDMDFSAGGGNSFNMAYGSNVQAGDLLLHGFIWLPTSPNNNQTWSSVTDTQGNLWTVLPTSKATMFIASSSYYCNIQWAWAIAKSSGANTVTANFTGPDAVPYIWRTLLEVSGTDPVNPIDGVAANTGTSAAPSAGTVASFSSSSQEYGVTIMIQADTGALGSDFTPGSGWTKQYDIGAGNSNQFFEDGFFNAAPVSGNATTSANAIWVASMLMIKQPASTFLFAGLSGVGSG